jgi:hypothetical protein
VVPAESAVAAAPRDPVPEAGGKPNLIKNMALFLSAPFIGLLYAVLLPFVGIGLLAWTGGKALVARKQAAPASDPLKELM